MPSLAYRAAAADGRIVRGVEDVASTGALARVLDRRGLHLIDASPASDRRERSVSFRTRHADVVEAARYLATLVEADFPVDRALGAVARAVSRRDVTGAIGAVRQSVRAGASIADAIAEHPRIFPPIAVGMVRAGERGGHLADALGRLADQLEREQAIRARLLSAAFYPAIMIGVGAVALAVLLFHVLPRFVGLIAETGGALPRSTALLLATGEFLGQWWPALLLLLAGAIFAAAAYRRSAGGRRTTDRVLLHLPVIGPMRRRIAAIRLGRSLATLLGSGLPVLSALDTAAHSVADRAASEEIARAREAVRTGTGLADALRERRIFPDLFIQMVDMGEESGRLPKMLHRAAGAFEQDLERRIERLLRLVEPVLILVFGAAVGFVALALLQAIYGVHADAF